MSASLGWLFRFYLPSCLCLAILIGIRVQALAFVSFQAPSVDRSLKPVVIVAVGDVALSLGGAKFARFSPWLIELLVQAGVTPYDAGPPNWQVSSVPITFVG